MKGSYSTLMTLLKKVVSAPDDDKIAMLRTTDWDLDVYEMKSVAKFIASSNHLIFLYYAFIQGRGNSLTKIDEITYGYYLLARPNSPMVFNKSMPLICSVLSHDISDITENIFSTKMFWQRTKSIYRAKKFTDISHTYMSDFLHDFDNSQSIVGVLRAIVEDSLYDFYDDYRYMQLYGSDGNYGMIEIVDTVIDCIEIMYKEVQRRGFFHEQIMEKMINDVCVKRVLFERGFVLEDDRHYYDMFDIKWILNTVYDLFPMVLKSRLFDYFLEMTIKVIQTDVIKEMNPITIMNHFKWYKDFNRDLTYGGYCSYGKNK